MPLTKVIGKKKWFLMQTFVVSLSQSCKKLPASHIYITLWARDKWTKSRKQTGNETVSSKTKIKIKKMKFDLAEKPFGHFLCKGSKETVCYARRQAPKLNKYKLALLRRILLNTKARTRQLLWQCVPRWTIHNIGGKAQEHNTFKLRWTFTPDFQQ